MKQFIFLCTIFMWGLISSFSLALTVPNSNMENWTDGGFTDVDWQGDIDLVASQDGLPGGTLPYTGDYCAFVTLLGMGIQADRDLTSNFITGILGEKYYKAQWAVLDNTPLVTIQLTILWFDASDLPIGSSVNTNTSLNNSAWQSWEVTTQAPLNAAKAKLQFRAIDETPGWELSHTPTYNLDSISFEVTAPTEVNDWLSHD